VQVLVVHGDERGAAIGPCVQSALQGEGAAFGFSQRLFLRDQLVEPDLRAVGQTAELGLLQLPRGRGVAGTRGS